MPEREPHPAPSEQPGSGLHTDPLPPALQLGEAKEEPPSASVREQLVADLLDYLLAQVKKLERHRSQRILAAPLSLEDPSDRVVALTAHFFQDEGNRVSLAVPKWLLEHALHKARERCTELEKAQRVAATAQRYAGYHIRAEEHLRHWECVVRTLELLLASFAPPPWRDR